MFGLAPNLTFAPNSTAKRVAAVNTGSTARLGAMPNFWDQFLHNRVIAANSRFVPARSCVLVILSNPDATFFMLMLLSSSSSPSGSGPQAVLFVSLLADVGRPVTPPVRGVSDRSRYPRRSRGSVWALPACSHTVRRRDMPGGRKMMIHQDRLPISPKTRSLEKRLGKRETNSMDTTWKCTIRHRTRQ